MAKAKVTDEALARALPADLADRVLRQAEEAEEAAKRHKATFDLPKVLIEAIREIAEAERVSRSDLAAWALAEFVLAYRAGEVDLKTHREPATRSPWADWRLRIGPLEDVSS